MLTPLLTSIPLTDNNILTISTFPSLQAAYSGVYKLHINTFKLNQYLLAIKMFINIFKLNQYLLPIQMFINAFDLIKSMITYILSFSMLINTVKLDQHLHLC